MRFSLFFAPRKKRLLTGLQLPMHSEALLSQMKEAVALALHFPIDPPQLINNFFLLLERYPLLCGIVAELSPRDAALFWETYGEWLLHKVHHPVPTFVSPRISPAAHRDDVYTLKWATHHMWPVSKWRDEHCYRCFFKETTARPLRLVSAQCARHACQSWALRLLQDLRNKHPGLTPKSLLPKRQRKGAIKEKKSTKRRADDSRGVRQQYHPETRPKEARRQGMTTKKKRGQNNVEMRISKESRDDHVTKNPPIPTRETGKVITVAMAADEAALAPTFGQAKGLKYQVGRSNVNKSNNKTECFRKPTNNNNRKGETTNAAKLLSQSQQVPSSEHLPNNSSLHFVREQEEVTLDDVMPFEPDSSISEGEGEENGCHNQHVQNNNWMPRTIQQGVSPNKQNTTIAVKGGLHPIRNQQQLRKTTIFEQILQE